MLKRFNVKNFLSFNCNEDGTAKEFSMIGGKIRSNNERVYNDGRIKLLKFASIYGANASGKSNIIKTMNFAKKTIIKELPIGCTNMYCKTNSNNKEKKSYFEFEFLLNGKYYAYGFEVLLSKRRFISEWLIELTSNDKEKIIFCRDIVKNINDLSGFKKYGKLFEKLNNYIEDIPNTKLFLTSMNQDKDTIYKNYKSARILKDVFLWVSECLDINYANEPISTYEYFTSNDNISIVTDYLNKFKTGISDYKIEEVDSAQVYKKLPKKLIDKIKSSFEEASIHKKDNSSNEEIGILRGEKEYYILEFDNYINDVIFKTIRFSHNNINDFYFRLNEESDGTVRLFDLLDILLCSKDKVYIIDEFDRCLHPNLTCYFIKEFLKQAQERNVQLIITTHESRLLDLDIVRQDEVWFVQKDKKGESDIYSLDEYNERFDKKIDKAYLDGRYGASPIFNYSLLEGDER